jgi:hypothetical protein
MPRLYSKCGKALKKKEREVEKSAAVSFNAGGRHESFVTVENRRLLAVSLYQNQRKRKRHTQ